MRKTCITTGSSLTTPQKGKTVRLIRQVVKYGISGGLAAAGAWIVSIALYHLAGFPYVLDQGTGFIAGTAINYPVSRRWAFHSHYPTVLPQLTVFLTVTLIGLGINEGTLWVAVSRFHLWVPMAMGIGLFTAFVWNFTMNRWLTFGKLEKT